MKKLLATLPLLLYIASSVVFAQPSVQMSVVDYPKYIVPSEIRTDVPITLVINTSLDSYTVSDSRLDILVTDSRGKILYVDSRYVGLYEGTTTYTWYIPSSIIKKLEAEDGAVNVKMQLTVLFTDDQGNYVIDNDNNVEITIQIKDYVKAGDIDVLFLAPNLDKVRELERKTYTFMLKLRNDDLTLDSVAEANVYVTIYDQLGNIVLEVPTVVRLNPGEERTVVQDINLALLDPGYYTIEVRIESDGLVLYNKKWDVGIGVEEIVPIKVLSYTIVPPVYNKGDLVMAKIIVRNTLLKDVTLQVEAVSEDLGLYRKLNSITLEPGETKEIRVVIPIPKDITGGEKTVTIRFWYGPSVYEKKIKLVLPTEKQVQEEKVLSISAPETFEVKELPVNVPITLTTYVEDLVPVTIELSTQNVDAQLDKTALLVGGYGLSRDVTIYIKQLYGDEGKVTVKVYDMDGKLLASKTITLVKPEKQTVPITSGTQFSSKDIKYLVVAILALIVAVILYKLYRKSEEEHPSE